MSESNPAVVWVVGEADDHIAAVFTQEKDAEAYRAAKAAQVKHDFWWIEEVPLDPVLVSGLSPSDRKP